MKWIFRVYFEIIYWSVLKAFGRKPSTDSIERFYSIFTELISLKYNKLRFMNYGFHDDSYALSDVISGCEQENEKYSAQLYCEAITPQRIVELKDKDVLEIGCGRGGGTALVARYMAPKTAVGIDLSPKAIENCRSWFQGQSNLTFIAGDAQQLPCSDQSFDAIISVESAHGYPLPGKFIAEVARVLRNGGYFFLTDFMTRAECEFIEKSLKDHHLSIIEQRDITKNVLQAISRDQNRKMTSLYSEEIPTVVKNVLKEFMGSEGTIMNRRFALKSLTYRRYVIQKS